MRCESTTRQALKYLPGFRYVEGSTESHAPLSEEARKTCTKVSHLNCLSKFFHVGQNGQGTVNKGSAITLPNPTFLRSVLALRISLIVRAKPTHRTIPSNRQERLSRTGT